jgi:hypothetical protein
MNVRPIARRFIEARLTMLQALACFAAGWFLCVGWMLVIRFAPDLAVDLIAKAGAL